MDTISLLDGEYHNNDDNLEIFTIIWLDAGVHNTGSQVLQQKMRPIINHLMKFGNGQECQQYIEQRSKEDRLVLIVSGQLGRDIVPRIHNLRQISSIYIYCMNKEANKEWSRIFAKVKDVIVKSDELIAQIKVDQKILMKVEEPLLINIFTTNSNAHTSVAEINNPFVYFQFLVDCFLRMKSNEIDNKELISLYEREYEGNDSQMTILREFQRDYSSDKALWWYTRESFLYKTLNKALSTQNIHMIFLLRSFISDIKRQLQQHQSKSSLRVYRSQVMSTDELDNLKQYIGQFISINSFFSTTTDRSKALAVFGRSDSSSDLQRVLFEIDANPGVATSKPFANISSQSEFVDESEVLFTLGSIFRLQDISRGDDQVWIVRVILCDNDEHDLKEALARVKNQSETGEANLRTLGKMLWKMGKFDLAEKYYHRLLNELPANDPSLRILYEDLGEMASQKGNYEMSVQWHRQAIAIKKAIPPTDDTNIYGTSNFIDYFQDTSSLPDRPQCPSHDLCNQLNDEAHMHVFFHRLKCQLGAECKDIDDEKHSKAFKHPDYCADKGYCKDMNELHLFNYRHVPLCKDSFNCALMIKNNPQHCETYRHCKLNCPFGGFCIDFHNHEHIEDQTHPFNSPCPYTPYMCQFHVKALQNTDQTECTSPAVDMHCFRYSHVCPFGQQCISLANKDHIRSNIHIARMLCPDEDRCKLITDENHLNSFSHPNIRDIRSLCQYAGSDCRARSHPEHMKRFRHAGNFHHAGVVHYSGFNKRINFVRNQNEMIEAIRSYLQSVTWNQTDMPISDELRQWIRALQPVHRCNQTVFESILVHGHVMSRDHMNLLRQPQFVANAVKQHKKVRRIFDPINNSVVQRICQEYIQILVEMEFNQSGQPTATSDATKSNTDAKATSTTTGSQAQPSTGNLCVESKLRQKEMMLNRYVKNEDIDTLRVCTVEIAQASLQLHSSPTGIGFPSDEKLGTNKHVFGVLGPHTGYYYGDIILVFRHELMWHPDSNFSIQAATTFGQSMNAYKFRPWLKDPGSPETRIQHFHTNKLHCSVPGYENAAASELIALTGLKAKSTADIDLKAIQQRWVTIDSHCVFEAHLPQLIPLDYVDRVYIAKTTFNSLSASAQQSAQAIFGSALTITPHEVDVSIKPAGLREPLDATRVPYQSFVIKEISETIERRVNSLPPIWGTIITIPASKFERHIVVPVTISQSYSQYVSNQNSSDPRDVVYIYWQAVYGEMMLTVTSEMIDSRIEQPNLQCLTCYIAEWPSNSTIENPAQVAPDYREGYSYISNDPPFMHEMVAHNRQVKASSNSFHRGCNMDDYITYCLEINRTTGEVTLSHSGPNRMYNQEMISYTFDKAELDLTKLDYIQVSAGSQTVPVRHLVLRHQCISELHPPVDKTFTGTRSVSTSTAVKVIQPSSSEKTSPPCADSINCLLQYATTKAGSEHNAQYTHPCRFSELCRHKAKEPHLVHITHRVPMCENNKNCSQLGEPLHRAQYRHYNLPDYLVPCRYQQKCKNTTAEHHVKYSHGEPIPLPS